MAGSPLIISGKAARRLRLLQLPPSPPRPAAAAAAAAGAAATVASGLPAALLEEPAPAGDASGSWLADRDVLYEVAATVRTLQELQIPSGALVLVAAVGRPEVPPHLARLLALTHPPRGASPRDGGGGPTGAEPADGVAYLAPSLAHNLGLALHLTPLLLLDGGDGTRDSAGSPGRAPLDRVLIQRYAGVTSQEEQQQQGQQQQGQQQRLAQPGSEAVLVPVAGEADFAVVRTPAPALLQQRPQTGAAEGAAAREPGQPPASAGSGDGAGPGPAAALASTDGGGDPTAGGGAAPPAASDDAAAALQQWLLAARRVVQLGDVVAVPRPPPSGTGPLLPLALPNLSVPPALANPAAGAASAPLELIYFRVVRLVVPGEAGAAAAGAAAAAAVDVRGTTVKLAGSCCSGLPVGLPHYLAAAACGDSAMLCRSRRVLGACAAAAEAPLAVLPPAGLLLPAWRQVAQLLATVLHPAAAALPLRLAILLHGPPGSGKRTAAAAAAAAAGCHLVSLSAHDVKAAAGAAERHTFEGLRAAFSAAADYRPALLLLEDVAALGDGSSHGGSGSSSAQSYAARLGSVLADCIRAHGGAAADPGNAGSAGGRGSTGVAAPAGSAASGLFPAPVVLLGCAAAADDLPAPLRRCFTHELAVEAPDQAQRSQLLASFLAGAPTAPDLAGQGAPASEDGHASDVQRGSGGLEEAARHTAGLLPRELRAVAADAAAAAALQALPPAAVLRALDGRGAANGASTPTLDPPQAAPSEGAPALAQRHLSAAIEAVRQRTATDIGAPRIPSVRWEDVGGLQDVKRAILDTVELPLKHPELFAGGLRRRSGVLLYGPPGTGKTLLAKAVATECATSFLSVKGPELINQYVGESERQIREVFARARRARPCVVFFDELDSLAPARGRGSDSGGVMDRLVSQLLAEIDGVQGSGASGDVFVVGATNRPDLLDPALLRPGRLDRLLYVGIAADVPSRLQVLQALTRRFNLAPGVDLGEVAARCADRFTGADLYALCADAWMTALKRSIAHLERQQQQPEQQQQEASGEAAAGDDRRWDGDPGGGGEGEEEEVVVTQEDLLAAAASLQPSLSAEEVARYERIRDQYNSKG